MTLWNGQILYKEPSISPTRFIGEKPESRLIRITEVEYPRLELKFGGKNKDRDPEIIEVAEFIGVKSHRARGKRLSNYEVRVIGEVESQIEVEPERSEALVEVETERQDPEKRERKKPEREAQQKPEKAVRQKPEKAVRQKPEKAVRQKPEKAVRQKPEKAVQQKPQKAARQKPEKAVKQEPDDVPFEIVEPQDEDGVPPPKGRKSVGGDNRGKDQDKKDQDKKDQDRKDQDRKSDKGETGEIKARGGRSEPNGQFTLEW